MTEVMIHKATQKRKFVNIGNNLCSISHKELLFSQMVIGKY